MKLNILIVEDNFIIALDIKRVCIKYKLNVVGIVSNEKDVGKILKVKKVDIIIMDIFLENKENGINIIKNIYKKKYIPVIYLSGNKDSNIIKSAIETKPLSYLGKPFREIDLISAIQLYYFRNSNNIIINSKYSFNQLNKHLYYENKIIRLTSNEKNFINFLVSAKGNIVSFREIENELWLEEVVSSDALRVLVYRLRKKLKSDIIETVYGFGFRLNFKSSKNLVSV